MNQVKTKLARFKVAIVQSKKEIKRIEKETTQFELELGEILREKGSGSEKYLEGIKKIAVLKKDLDDKRATLKQFEGFLKGIVR